MNTTKVFGIGLGATLLAVGACSDNEIVIPRELRGTGGTGVSGSGGAQPFDASIGGAAGQAGSSGSSSAGANAGGEHTIPTLNGLRAGTYNAGLAPFYQPLVQQRRPEVFNALAKAAKTLDVLCVQEVWLESDHDEFATRLSSEMPNTYRRAPEPGSSTCAALQLDPLAQCLVTMCADHSGEALVECAVDLCSGELATLEPGCLNCVMGRLSLPLVELYLTCIGPGDKNGALFDGAFGTALFTREPLLRYESIRFSDDDAYALRNAVHYGVVQLEAGDYVHVFCAHLSSELGVLAYQGPHADWDTEHAAQMARLRESIDDKASSGSILVLGDLNMGPECGNNVGVLADQFDAFCGGDLFAPFAAVDAPVCTVCPSNTLVSDRANARLTDHVLTRGVKTDALRRFLTERVEVEVNGETVVTSLSDHYGLRVRLY